MATPRENGLTYTVARSGSIIQIPNMRESPIYAGTPESWQGSIVGFPLKFGDQVVGVMNIGHKTPNAFSENQLRILRLLSSHAAIGIINARLHMLVGKQARTDPLTGLYNRRMFNHAIREEIRRSERYHHVFCLGMLDLNQFKKVNDQFGHPIGDTILKKVADCFADNIRKTDFLARYGGDEFALIMPETGLIDAQVLSKRLQESISSSDFNLPPQAQVQITASIGIATFPQDGTDIESLVAAADRALYRDKRGL
jgi:diguanylate cyclase (GGDEF)-like protein